MFSYYSGLEILGFPCNQFGSQEPGTNEEIQEFVCTRFKAEYPIFDKVWEIEWFLLGNHLKVIVEPNTYAFLCELKIDLSGIVAEFDKLNWYFDLWSYLTASRFLVSDYVCRAQVLWKIQAFHCRLFSTKEINSLLFANIVNYWGNHFF